MARPTNFTLYKTTKFSFAGFFFFFSYTNSSTASKILSYKAPLTLKHIWLLSEKLGLPVELLAKPRDFLVIRRHKKDRY